MSDHALMMFLAYESLAHVWGDEWDSLNDADRDNVAADFLQAECTASEYQRRIYVGNLASYARCIR